MTRASIRGVILRSSVIIAELVAFIFTGSSVLLLDGLSSLVDVASSLFLLFCIRIAEKPPDQEHPFGHGRYEPIAGLQLSIFLAVLGITLLIQQSTALAEARAQATFAPWLFVIPLFSAGILEICHRVLKRTAEKQHSPALLADAFHYRADSLNSLCAVVALLLAAFLPQYGHLFDHLGAILIALFMVISGSLSARSNVQQLLDRTPDAEILSRVRDAALSVPRVLATEKLLVQSYGPDAHVSIDIEVDPAMSVEEAHAITQHVRVAIQKSWPAVRDAIVHVEPFYPNDHL